jgi:hypothetical protein
MNSASTLTPRQAGYLTRASDLLPASAQPQLTQAVDDLLAHAVHGLDDRDVLDLLRPLLAEHGLSVGELLSKPPLEYARYERKRRHASHPVL